jgi:hypothetical protein
MPVFRVGTLENIDNSIITIAEMFYKKTLLILKPDEFIEAFVEPHHLSLLRDVVAITGPIGETSMATRIVPEGGDKSMSAVLSFSGTPPVPMPKYVQNGLTQTCPPELRYKIQSWAADRAKFGMAFGLMRYAVPYLSERCGDARAMALFMPCLPQLMAGISADPNNHMVKRAQRLTQRTQVPKLPRIEPSIREAISYASAMLQAAAMAASAPELNMKRGECYLRITSKGNLDVPDLFTGSPTSGMFY